MSKTQVMPEHPPAKKKPRNDYKGALAQTTEMCRMLASVIIEKDNQISNMIAAHNAQMNSMINWMNAQQQTYLRNEQFHYDYERSMSNQINDLQREVQSLGNRGVFGQLGDKLDKIVPW